MYTKRVVHNECLLTGVARGKYKYLVVRREGGQQNKQ